MTEIRDYINSLSLEVDIVDISNESTYEYLLNEKYKNRGIIVLLEMQEFNFSRVGHNTDFAFMTTPTIAVQVFSSIQHKEEINFKLATKVALQLIKRLNGYKTDYFGKLMLPNDFNLTPINLYSTSGAKPAYKVAWGIEFLLNGKVKLNTNLLEE